MTAFITGFEIWVLLAEGDLITQSILQSVTGIREGQVHFYTFLISVLGY
jgi:hypothetical protein